MTIPAFLIREEQVERRREKRWRVRLGARWLDCQPEGRPLMVLDLSTSGFLVEVDWMLPVGTCLIVDLPHDSFKICRIAWSRGNFHGAEFSDPLSNMELQRIIDATRETLLPVGQTETAACDLGPRLEPESLGLPLMDSDDRSLSTTSSRIIVVTTTIFWALLATSLWLAGE